MGSDLARSPRAPRPHGRAPGSASTAVAAVAVLATNLPPAGPARPRHRARRPRKAASLGRREGGAPAHGRDAAEREVSALRGRTSTTATDGDEAAGRGRDAARAVRDGRRRPRDPRRSGPLRTRNPGDSRVVPLSPKMVGSMAVPEPRPGAGGQSMGRVRPQASASPYRQQPQKPFSVRF